MMIRIILASVVMALLSEVKTASANYVWARSQWSVGPNKPVGAMTNGYGGYYVPRNAYGNNFEGQRFTNPNGFIIPANSGQQYQQRGLFRRR